MKSSTPALWIICIILVILFFFGIRLAFQQGWLHQRHPLTLHIHPSIHSAIHHA